MENSDQGFNQEEERKQAEAGIQLTDLQNAPPADAIPGDEDNKEDSEGGEEKEITVYDIQTHNYTRRNIRLTYAFLFYANMSLNLDHGAMPAAAKALEVGLDLTAPQLGWLGSLVFIGLFFGSVAAAFILARCPFKWVLFASYAGNTCGLFSFAYCTIYDFQCLARFCSGFCQIFNLIYLPVWINTIGDKENISYYMSFYILSTPLGVIVGYILTAVVINESTWQWSFYIMSMNMLALAIGMMCFSKHYINYDLMLTQFSRIKQQRARALYQGVSLDNAGQAGINQDAESEGSAGEESVDANQKGACATLWHLKGNLVFMMCICGLTCLYFIITNIQYWVTLYLINIIGATESMAQTAFAIICVTAPTTGAVASGPITKWVGGYESPNALRLALFLSVLCGAIAFPLPLLDNFYLVCILLWLYLLVGGMLVPLATGTYLANVEEEYRTVASAMANIFYEAFGYAPAPYVYGIVQGSTGGKLSRWGLIVTLMVNIPPILFLLIGVIYQTHKISTDQQIIQNSMIGEGSEDEMKDQISQLRNEITLKKSKLRENLLSNSSDQQEGGESINEPQTVEMQQSKIINCDLTIMNLKYEKRQTQSQNIQTYPISRTTSV